MEKPLLKTKEKTARFFWFWFRFKFQWLQRAHCWFGEVDAQERVKSPGLRGLLIGQLTYSAEVHLVPFISVSICHKYFPFVSGKC